MATRKKRMSNVEKAAKKHTTDFIKHLMRKHSYNESEVADLLAVDKGHINRVVGMGKALRFYRYVLLEQEIDEPFAELWIESIDTSGMSPKLKRRYGQLKNLIKLSKEITEDEEDDK